ncbi:hypothetical protein ET33_27190 [Paenibacillus tyrfis]|uniref:Uncharacterized protein n=1 Tax=Paenibacillus tyrfis TaxID=1501230 RepID=A0A081NUY9_9BACL|nr:hypothetical protein ET33_27190 [Paenibacillus tyrfis]
MVVRIEEYKMRKYSLIGTYKKFFDEKTSIISKIITILVLAVFLYFLIGTIGLLFMFYFPATIFFLYMIVALLSDPYSNNLSKFLSFTKYFPISSKKIIYYHYIYRCWNTDQIITQVFFMCILLFLRIPIYCILIFFIRLHLAMFIPQMVEYIVYFIKTNIRYQFFLQVIIICISLITIRVKIPLIFNNYNMTTFSYQIDFVLLFVTVLLFIISLVVINSILRTNERRVNNNLVINNILILINKFIFLLFKFLNKDSYIIILLNKIYLRDYTLVSKFGRIMLATILIYIYGLINKTNLYSSTSWLLGLFFFSEFRLISFFDKDVLLKYFPLTDKRLKISVDLASGSLYLIFSFLLISLQYIILQYSLSNYFLEVWSVVGCYLLMIILPSKHDFTKFKKTIIQIIYSILSLVLILLNQKFVYFSPFIYALLIVYYMKATNKLR